MEYVILVDRFDNALGTMEKMEAHRKGVLHRAFSVLVFNSKGEMLLQKRAAGKYHSAGLWTNTCCSHPGPSESLEESARRRVQYEMGIDVEPVFAFKFIYRASLDNNLTEHELDHVFTATFDGEPHVNPEEVSDWQYVSMPALRADMAANPAKYTAWFKDIVNNLELKIEN
jgi:isopentenyl-diphosphate delta-isomerase